MADVHNSAGNREWIRAWVLWSLLATACLICWPRHETQSMSGTGLLILFAAASCILLFRRYPRKIAVLNYHSVSPSPEWLFPLHRWLSMHPRLFEWQVRYLADRGYRTVFMSELHAILAGDRSIRNGEKYVALTFDDGYLDNWTCAFPILHKYGMKATVFVSTDFIDPGTACRPQDSTANGHMTGESCRGYLNLAEITSMVGSGLVEVQSHGKRHERVFISDRLKGFVSPDAPDIWLTCRTSPERKASWWRYYPDPSLHGHPLFEQGTGLCHRAFCPDRQAIASMLAFAQNQPSDFFSQQGWETELAAEWERLPETGSAFESPHDYLNRVKDELAGSKSFLESSLGKPVDFFCWPENEFTGELRELARSAGYKATISNFHDGPNVIGRRPDRITRSWVGEGFFGWNNSMCNRIGFAASVALTEGCYFAYPVLATASVLRKIRSAGGISEE